MPDRTLTALFARRFGEAPTVPAEVAENAVLTQIAARASCRAFKHQAVEIALFDMDENAAPAQDVLTWDPWGTPGKAFVVGTYDEAGRFSGWSRIGRFGFLPKTDPAGEEHHGNGRENCTITALHQESSHVGTHEDTSCVASLVNPEN